MSGALLFNNLLPCMYQSLADGDSVQWHTSYHNTMVSAHEAELLRVKHTFRELRPLCICGQTDGAFSLYMSHYLLLQGLTTTSSAGT